MPSGGQESQSQSTTKLPDWYVKFAKDALGLSQKTAQIGYTPYMGPDVAAFNPQQIAGMQGAQDWNQAFAGANAPRQKSVASTLMPATQFGKGGPTGYSSYGGFQDVMEKFKAERPGQYKAIMDFAIDPKTGKIAPNYKKMIKTTESEDPLKYTVKYRPNPGQSGGGGGNH